MKPKLLIVAAAFISVNLPAQSNQFQIPAYKSTQERSAHQYVNQYQHPVNYASYDSAEHRIIYTDEQFQNISTGEDIAKSVTNTFHLVKDINTATDSDPNNFKLSVYGQQQFAVLNNIVYYGADDGIHGFELWKSDGTAAGTKMVKDIYPGQPGSAISEITVSNGKLYFAASSPKYGNEVWTSDGTAGGTKILKDIVAGQASSFPMNLCNVNGTLFFTNGGTNQSLWKSDGTTAGTIMVADLTASLNATETQKLVAVNNLLFFTAVNTSYNNRELWRSDGTDTGTYLLKDIDPYPYGSGPSHLTAYKNKLYFCENDGSNHQYLWVSDGTAEGTSYAPGNNNVTVIPGNDLYPSPFIIAGNSMYFPAQTVASGRELFRYNADDGLGVVLVKDINASGNNTYLATDAMAAIGNTAYFAFIDSNGISQLWKTTGSDGSTKKVADLNNVTTFGGFCSSNNMVYFSAYTASAGKEVWKSDGTASNTGILKNINPGAVSSNPSYFTASNNKIFFNAANASNGSELWQTDGTLSNTYLVKNINKTTTSTSLPQLLTPFNNSIIFSAYTPATGTEAYVSDGNAAGTNIIKDIIPGETNSNPTNFKVKNGFAYFLATDKNLYPAIFKTNGTSGNATELNSFPSENYYFNGDYVIADNGTVFYMLGNESTDLWELWKSDGSANSNSLVKAGLEYTPQTLTAMTRNVYFSAYTNTSYGYELWKSDGTTQGTKMLKDIYTGADGSNPHNLYAYHDTLYFAAASGFYEELWKSDGTTAGTKKVKAVYPSSFQASGNTLYFIGNTNDYGAEIWKTDGTAGGTRLVKDLMIGAQSSNPANLTDVNGTLFFSANDGKIGSELWKTKGNSGSTKLVKNISNTGFGSFSNFTVSNSKLFFLVDTSYNSRALWTSDGTNGGTYAINDNGLNELSVLSIVGNGSNLYLSADSYNYGDELYVGDASALNTLQKNDTIVNTVVVNTLSAQLATNPFSNSLSINISSTKKQDVSIIVSDASGNIYHNKVINMQPGKVNYTINTGAWMNGIYIMRLTSEQEKSNVVTLKALK